MGTMHVLPKLMVVEREQFLISKCIGKRILHLGAVDFYMGGVCGLHRKLMDVADSLIGIDIDSNGIELAKTEGVENIYCADLEKLQELNINATVDTIVAGEVIEHLSNVGLFLEGIKKFFNPNTEMILTTPNAFSFHRFFFSLRRFEYVHPDHTCYYSYRTLRYLLQRHGFVIREELAYVLQGNLVRLRKQLGRINFNFTNGLIFVVTLRGGE